MSPQSLQFNKSERYLFHSICTHIDTLKIQLKNERYKQNVKKKKRIPKKDDTDTNQLKVIFFKS